MTIVDQNGVSCFVDQNAVATFVDENGDELNCTATSGGGQVLMPQACM